MYVAVNGHHHNLGSGSGPEADSGDLRSSRRASSIQVKWRRHIAHTEINIYLNSAINIGRLSTNEVESMYVRMNGLTTFKRCLLV